jgi:hypothetical protein
MIHFAKPHEHVWIESMGKSFRVRAISTTVDEANAFMARHDEAVLIACFGEFNIIANQYEGLRHSDKKGLTNDER